MFIEDYRELNLPDAERIGSRCFLFEQFLDDLFRHEPAALLFPPRRPAWQFTCIAMRRR